MKPQLARQEYNDVDLYYLDHVGGKYLGMVQWNGHSKTWRCYLAGKGSHCGEWPGRAKP